MKFSVVSTHDLDAGLKARWDALRTDNPALASPYFTWQYLDALTATGRAVRVVVVEDGPEVVAFMGFERLSPIGIAAPGGKLTDYHGIIGKQDVAVPPGDLLRACGARLLHFDHVPASQPNFAHCAHGMHGSPAMDLQGGWDAYVDRLAKIQGRKVPGIVARVRQARKGALKQLGTVHLVFHEANHATLDRLMALKSQQYKNTPGANDAFAFPWIRQLMHDLLDRQTPQLKGVLSSLYADNTLLASHFGIQSDGLLHAWFPAYDAAHSAHSPGLMMFHDMGVHAQAHGVNTIDFGRGEQDYKLRFMTHSTELIEGVLARPQWMGNVWMASQRVNRKIRSSIKNNPTIHSAYHRLKHLGLRP